jgi:WhiB family redox-sensing transcriptional regulator
LQTVFKANKIKKITGVYAMTAERVTDGYQPNGVDREPLPQSLPQALGDYGVVVGDLDATASLLVQRGLATSQNLARLEPQSMLGQKGNTLVAHIAKVEPLVLSVDEAAVFMRGTVIGLFEKRIHDRRRQMPAVNVNMLWLRMLDVSISDIKAGFPERKSVKVTMHNTATSISNESTRTRIYLPDGYVALPESLPPAKVLRKAPLYSHSMISKGGSSQRVTPATFDQHDIRAMDLFGVDVPEGVLSWQEKALCTQTNPDSFFPEKGESAQEAKRVCRSCEVRSECLKYALDKDEPYGIWGGLSELERRRVRRQSL